MDKLEQVINLLKEIEQESETTANDQLVADFSLHIMVYGDGRVHIESPQSSNSHAVVAPPSRAPRKGFTSDPQFEREGRKVCIDGTDYISINEAARELGLTPYKVKDRCASDLWPTWTIKD